MPTIHIDCREIHDKGAFHRVFARELGFPDFYGRNGDAWIDCMSNLDDSDDTMTTVHAVPPDVVRLFLRHATVMPAHLLQELIELVAIANERYAIDGKPAMVTLVRDDVLG